MTGLSFCPDLRLSGVSRKSVEIDRFAALSIDLEEKQIFLSTAYTGVSTSISLELSRAGDPIYSPQLAR